MKKLSIIIPVYNEEKTVAKTLKRILAVKLGNLQKEIYIVNDGSSDNSLKEIKKVKDSRINIIDKTHNQGKGAAIKSALEKISGDVVIIQDADLEYNPNEIPKLLDPINQGLADVVYGSRFMGGEARRVLFFWHMIGNKFLTLLSNALTNLNLADMETCYKIFTGDVAKKLNLKENGFGFEPEFTAKVAGMGARVYEVGISYSGRNYKEGKKINWKDGIWALYCLLKYNLFK